MLRYRVIPVVLLDGYSVLKTIKFDVRRNLGNPITVARIYNRRNVDELILLDIDASKQKRQIDIATVADVASECFMPLTVGGGLSSVDEIANVLGNGADKVALNTAVLNNPALIRESSGVFGRQCIVVSIDVKKDEQNDYQIFSHAAGRIDMSLMDWVREVESLGAGEILLNSVDHDGVMCGYDLNLIETISNQIKIPLIVCGGAAATSDAVSAINGGASAVAAASIFHFTNITPEDVKKDLSANGYPTRLLI